MRLLLSDLEIKPVAVTYKPKKILLFHNPRKFVEQAPSHAEDFTLSAHDIDITPSHTPSNNRTHSHHQTHAR